MSYLGRFHTHLLLTHTSRTLPRELIYATLWQIGPCDSKQILNSLRGKVGRVTVYRALNTFLKIGIIEEIRPGIFEITDRFKQHHHYFVCRQCKRRIAFNDKSAEEALQSIASQRRLTLEDHYLELIGLCSKCSTTPSAKPRSAIGTNLRRPLG